MARRYADGIQTLKLIIQSLKNQRNISETLISFPSKPSDVFCDLQEIFSVVCTH